MLKRTALLAALIFAFAGNALSGAKPDAWLQVRSPHFLVVTNANEKDARKVADQFELMRAVFHAAFPNLAIDSFAPITVIAVRNEKQFKLLEPEAYLKKGSLKLAGLFQRGPEKNYVLLRLDTEGEHPYAVVYHEYTHLLTSKAEWMPLWLNEGFAEFYENTDVDGKSVLVGRANAGNLYYLRDQRMLPLATLFAVDHTSPYYHEENKGSIFYAESWALTHYLSMTDFKENTHHVRDYTQLLAQKVDPVTAATQAFGDLKQLQTALDYYIRQQAYVAFKMNTPVSTKDLEFTVQPISSSQADAVRADFLAEVGRTADAQALLQQVLQADPNNVTAYETMGLLAVRAGKNSEARDWYAKAVKLDSQSYLANYNYASISMGENLSPEEEKVVESSLRTAIKLNPNYAPAYDRLAVFYGMHHRNLDEAYLLSLNAVQIEPTVITYRLNGANILMTNQRADNAVRVLETALSVAKTPQDIAQVQNALSMAKSFLRSQMEYEERRKAASNMSSANDGTAPVLRHATIEDADPGAPMPALVKRPFPPRGPRRLLEGTIRTVKCSTPAVMDLSVESVGHGFSLHSDNYYKVQFSALNFTPEGELKPCSQLEGMKARIAFVDVDGRTPAGQIVSVELSK